MSDLVPLFRAQQAIDSVLPEHMYKGVTGVRFWTNPNGSFRLHVEGSHPDKRFAFVDEVAGWFVQVPLTAHGLDALVLAMILAGAIEPHGVTSLSLLDGIQRLGSRGSDGWPIYGWQR